VLVLGVRGVAPGTALLGGRLTADLVTVKVGAIA
jgi:hypothetical protein